MTDVKCPYCPEVRPNRSRLQLHVDGMHRGEVPSSANRYLAVNNARTVETVTLAEVPERKPVLCTCGQELVIMDTNTDDPWWMHQVSTTKCSNAIPALGMPTGFDRKTLAERIRDNAAAMDRAANEMSQIRQQLAAVDNHVEQVVNRINHPDYVRRATLNLVWDKLIDAGQMTGAAIIMRMISGADDE